MAFPHVMHDPESPRASGVRRANRRRLAVFLSVFMGVSVAGLLCGIALTAPVGKAVETAARDAGFLINAAAPDVIRLAPPLIVTDEQIDQFLHALPHVLDTARPAVDA